MDSIEQLKNDVISASRILSQQNLVEGFGHVSARIRAATALSSHQESAWR
jgi:ribulose-5-phosphate 4-epimerase/fuculose-1-phosphate aldolase